MAFIVVVHVIACLLLVVTILMQSGRGGGLAESFSSAESMFGTQTNKFMVRLSTILAIIFFSTSLILAINSAKGNKSLMAQAQLPTKTAEAPVGESTVKVGELTPMNESKPVETAQKESVESQTTVVTNTVK